MKKFLSFALALVMILSLSVVAFADEDETQTGTDKKVDYAATDKVNGVEQITKYYDLENDVKVNETLHFKSVADTSNPDDGKANLDVKDLTTSFGENKDDNGYWAAGKVKFDIPSLPLAGTYKWTIKEDMGSDNYPKAAGVTYDSSEIIVIVLVGYDNTNNKLVILYTETYIQNTSTSEEGTTTLVKKDIFVNKFNSGSFSVAKDVIGNMANKNDTFEITVTLISDKPVKTEVKWPNNTIATFVKQSSGENSGKYIASIALNYADLNGKGAQSFLNIPTEVKVEVKETESNMGNYEQVGIYSGNYTVNEDLTVTGDEFNEMTVDNDTNTSITVVNKNETEIITGVSMDSIPYVVLLTVACLGLVVLFTKKRAARDF